MPVHFYQGGHYHAHSASISSSRRSVPTTSRRASSGQQTLRVEVCDVGWKKNMFERRSRGPKTSTWTRRSQNVFESFFARRSELLKVAAEDQLVMTAGALKWMFSSFGDEPRQVRNAGSLASCGAPDGSTSLNELRGLISGCENSCP